MLSKKISIILIILLTCVSVLWAGDSAVFIDLGFSPDGRTYMFGQHGVLSPSLRPWAELYVVDMASNNFVPNGRHAVTHNSPIRAGQDGSGVFYQLLAANSNLTNRYRLNFQYQGQPLYISRNENPPANGEIIESRDFNSGIRYRAELVPIITGSGPNLRSQFYIILEFRMPNGERKDLTVGTPHHLRPRITQYNIKRVIVDSTGNSMIFVIEMKRLAENSHDIRYMVEAVRF
jgi:predicted secreted protein